MSFQLKIDTSELKQLARKLQSVHKSALPIAVRGSLNDAAFDMKQNTMPSKFNDQFTIRKPSFLKAHSTVVKSNNTFDVNKMQSECGIIKGKSKAGDDLKIQEFGGEIKGKGIVPKAAVRISQDIKKLVSKTYYYTKFKSVKKGQVQRNKKKTIIKTDKALIQYEAGGKFTLLYSLVNSKKYQKREFVKPAGLLSSKKLPEFFIAQAKRQVEKYLLK